MDPNECWKMIKHRMATLRCNHGSDGEENDREQLVNELRDLADWIEKGGFIP